MVQRRTAVQVGVPEAVRVWLLGGFKVSVENQTIGMDDLRLRKARSLIKLLALAREHTLHREQVTDVLWPELDAKPAANNLHRAVYFVRRALEGARANSTIRYLKLRQDLLTLCPDGPLWVDVEAFEAAAARAHHGREPAAYRAAIDLYSGDLLPENRYDVWAEDRRRELRTAYLALLVGLASLYEERGDLLPSVEMLRRVVAEEPTHERASVDLMRMYAISGERRRAMVQYERLEKLLEELDDEPEAASRFLYEEISAGAFPRARMDPDSPPSQTARSAANKHNLPVAHSSFVGRELEVSVVKRSLAMTQLLTLTGMGGCGKTRLALKVASDLVGAYPDGAWMVHLAPVAQASLLPQTVAAALGVSEQPGRSLTETLSDYLASRQALLVLDNCEHLLDGTARLVDVLRSRCSGLRILATSREALGVAGKTNWPIPTLTVPENRDSTVETLTRYEAVRLFTERARSKLPSFTLTTRNAGAVAEVCRKLDGIPLAIELATARMGTLAVEQVAERLEDSLKLLTGGARTAEPRHQTMRATLEWSHELLSEKEQELFCRLSVFAGRWTLEATEAVGGGGIEQYGAASNPPVLDLLEGLVDKSLVVGEVSPVAGKGEMRYRMLEPVRQYAQERLVQSGEAKQVRERHARYFLALAERAEPELVGADQQTWFGRLETEHDNLRTALRWSLERGDPDLGLRLAGTLGREFWRVRGRIREGLGWLDAALERGGEASPERARALAVAGWIAWQRLDFERSRSSSEEALDLCRKLGDERATAAISLHNLGMVEIYGHMRAEVAWGFFEKSLALWRELGDMVGAGRVLQRMGLISVVRHDFDRAQALYEECVALSRDAGDRVGITIALWLGGLAALGHNEHEQARKLCEEGLALARRTSNTHAVSYITQVLAASFGERGLTTRSARLWGAAEALLDELGLTLGPAERHFYAPYLASVRERLGDAAFDEAWAEGKSMAPEDALALPQKSPASEGKRPADPLTRRQHEVALLVGRGLTNAQIADALAISPNTVANHVATILKKLDLASRSRIAAWVTERRLDELE